MEANACNVIETALQTERVLSLLLLLLALGGVTWFGRSVWPWICTFLERRLSSSRELEEIRIRAERELEEDRTSTERALVTALGELKGEQERLASQLRTLIDTVGRLTSQIARFGDGQGVGG